ncbi:MAG: hypothetical protein AAFQ98_07200 [Bacteroidota bacterium]
MLIKLRRKTTVGSILLLSLMVSCKSSQQTGNQTTIPPTPSLESLAAERFGEGYTIEYNRGKSCALVILPGNRSQAPGLSSAHFFVYDVGTQEIILEDKVNMGKVVWENAEVIRVTDYPGRYRPGVSTGYTFNITSKQKTPSKE